MSRPSLIMTMVVVALVAIHLCGCRNQPTEGAMLAPGPGSSAAASADNAGPSSPPVAPPDGSEVAATAETSSASSATTQAGDNVPPRITAPPDITTGGGPPEGREVDLGAPQVSDNADPNPRVTNDAPRIFPPGRTVVTWTATDASGNRATAQQVVIIDTNRPKGGGKAH